MGIEDYPPRSRDASGTYSGASEDNSDSENSGNESQPSSASDSGASTPLLELRETNRLLQQQLESDRLEMIAQERRLQDIKEAITRLEHTRAELVAQRQEYEDDDQPQDQQPQDQQQVRQQQHQHQQRIPVGPTVNVAAQSASNGHGEAPVTVDLPVQTSST